MFDFHQLQVYKIGKRLGEPLRTFLESTGDPEHNPHPPGGADPG